MELWLYMSQTIISDACTLEEKSCQKWMIFTGCEYLNVQDDKKNPNKKPKILISLINGNPV